MLVVAHRGAPHQAPENTLASFRAALAIGVDAIELDVHCSRDGELVVIHDQALARTTNGRGLVHEQSLDELRALDAGGWFAPTFAGEGIPTLDEAIETIGTRAALQVEIKGATAGVAEATVATLRRHRRLADTLVTSFHLDRLPIVSSLEPSLATGALVWGRTPDGRAMTAAEMIDATRRVGATIMLIWHEWIDGAVMSLAATQPARAPGEAAGGRGLPVGAAGGDADAAAMRRLLDLGVVRMTSNYPERLKQVVADYQGMAGHQARDT